MADGELSNVTPEAILHWTHQLSRSRRSLDEASSAHRTMVKQAKKDGVPTNAILESISWARMDPDERRKRIIDRIRVEAARHADDGDRLIDEVFRLDRRVADGPRQAATLFEAEQRGYDAGRRGELADSCPYEPGSEAAQTWRNYWHDGNVQHAASLIEGEKLASTRRQRRSPGRAASRGERSEGEVVELPRKRGRPKKNVDAEASARGV
jgi:ribosome modulation factor